MSHNIWHDTRITIAQLNALANGSALSGPMFVQLSDRKSKQSKSNKPYYEVSFSDAAASLMLRVFDNHPSFAHAGRTERGTCLVLDGNWSKGEYGIESADWTARVMTDEERAVFFSGTPELRAKQDKDFAAIVSLVNTLPLESPYRTLIVNWLSENEASFRRAAAAKGNHHARRGGLVEHVSYMMRAADALATLYAEVLPVNRALLLCGTFFHDIGKLQENNYPEQGFTQDVNFDAEALGHIAIGCGLVASLWMKLPVRATLRELRMLQHLILSHHGILEWGSPVVPKCPEAVILHFVDNCDAKLEMMRGCYATSERIGDGVVAKKFPLEGNLLEGSI